jgi:hypothetical protein
MNAKMWLLVDAALRKLKSARHWVTSADSYKEDIEAALAALESALEKIEKEKP